MKSPDGVTMDAVLVSASGGVNLLVLAVLFLSIWSRLARSCLILVGLVLPCLAATWIYFTKEHLAALIGHDLWVAGALLFAAPEILSIQRRRASARAETLATPAGT